jgi:hypothetical protein
MLEPQHQGEQAVAWEVQQCHHQVPARNYSFILFYFFQADEIAVYSNTGIRVW